MQNGVCVTMTDENLPSDDYPVSWSKLEGEAFNMNMNFV